MSRCLSRIVKVCFLLRRRMEFYSSPNWAYYSLMNFKCWSLKSPGRSFSTHSWRIS